MGKKVVLGAMGLVFTLSCGTIEATPDMTMTVNPNTLQDQYQANTQESTKEQSFFITLKTVDNKPASSVTVTAKIDSSMVGTLSFTDCPGSSECSCITNNSGACTIALKYKSGGNNNYKTSMLVYSGALSTVVSICIVPQGTNC